MLTVLVVDRTSENRDATNMSIDAAWKLIKGKAECSKSEFVEIIEQATHPVVFLDDDYVEMCAETIQL